MANTVTGMAWVTIPESGYVEFAFDVFAEAGVGFATDLASRVKNRPLHHDRPTSQGRSDESTDN